MARIRVALECDTADVDRDIEQCAVLITNQLEESRKEALEVTTGRIYQLINVLDQVVLWRAEGISYCLLLLVLFCLRTVITKGNEINY